MSLLMDALKRAEASKARTGGDDGKALEALRGEDLELAPLCPPASPPPSSRPGNPLPDLADHLAAVDADLERAARAPSLSTAGESTSASPPAPSPPSSPSTTNCDPRLAIRNAFAAKTSADPAGARRGWWIVLGLLGLSAAGIALFFIVELSQQNNRGLHPTTPQTAAPPPPSPLAPSVARPLLPAPTLSPSPAATPSGTPTPQAASRLPGIPRTATIPPEPPADTTAIRISRQPAAPDGDLLAAHAALQARNLAPARTGFEKVLRRDPHNADALLALAAIDTHEGRHEEASALRQRALIADPSAPAVQASVLGDSTLSPSSDDTESRLKALLAVTPDAGPLHFALGTLYARQGRWQEAQRAFFIAVTADGDNPDYLFNLAVALDQLQVTTPAAQHYRLALDASTRRGAAFDPAQVRRRLAELGR